MFLRVINSKSFLAFKTSLEEWKQTLMAAQERGMYVF